KTSAGDHPHGHNRSKHCRYPTKTCIHPGRSSPQECFGGQRPSALSQLGVRVSWSVRIADDAASRVVAHNEKSSVPLVEPGGTISFVDFVAFCSRLVWQRAYQPVRRAGASRTHL